MTWLVLPLLLYIAYVDIREHRIPNWAVLTLLVLTLGRVALEGPPALSDALLGAGVAGVPFFVAAFANAVGMGDAKLAFALGALLGYPAVVPGLLIATAAGGVVVLALVAAGRMGWKDPMPYGPFLVLGAVITMGGLTFGGTLW